MCGIAGFSGEFEGALLERMGEVIAHRGPDDQGIHFCAPEGIGLAHRRLSIIDLSELGRQPMWDASGRVVIVFNGEIYNYRELRDQLAAGGFSFRSNSDTECLLNLYLRNGEGMLQHLNGIFAFAIWDTQKRSLFLARDGVGVKPLYYAETSKGFLFASELKALLLEPSLARELDPEAVCRYLSYLYSPGSHTMLKSVRKLEPGHAAWVRDGRIERMWQFYDLPYTQPIQELSEGEAIEQVRDCLEQAVRRQMVADVPVGAFLSGGLDSSAIVHFARSHAGNPLPCFTIGFEGSSFQSEGFTDDLPYAKRVAAHLGVDLHVVQVGPDFVQEALNAIYYLDEPQGDPAAINVLLICRLARQHGIKVLLSGTGGDDIFAGYRRHTALLAERYWSWLPKYGRSSLKRITSGVRISSARGRRLQKAFRYSDLDGDERIASYFYWLDPQTVQGLLGPALRDCRVSVSQPLLDSLRHLPAATPPLNRMLYLDGKFFLPDLNLNYTDKMAMASGVEVRVPLLDPDLVSLAARLPLALKHRAGMTKWILRQAMEPWLPRDVVYRPKTGFGVPLRRWLHGELRDVVEDTLSASRLRAHGLFDPTAVHELIRRDREGKVDAAYPIFCLMWMEMWLSVFLDQPSGSLSQPRPVAVS